LAIQFGLSTGERLDGTWRAKCFSQIQISAMTIRKRFPNNTYNHLINQSFLVVRLRKKFKKNIVQIFPAKQILYGRNIFLFYIRK
jgi:hypothetical protein